MSEEKEQAQPTPQTPRPALPVISEQMATLAYYGRLSGWAGAILLLVTLFWISVVKSLNRLPIKVLGIIALLGLAFWIYTNIHQLILSIRTRGVQSALNSGLFSLFILGIIVLINYIGYRHEVFRVDLSKGRQYSLAEQTVEILKKLDKPVTITAFISNEYYNEEKLRRLLREYDLRGGSKLEVRFYDFKTDIDKVQEYGARFDGTMYVETGSGDNKRKEEIQGGTEEQITSAILAVTTGEKTRICVLTGHGEATPDGGGPDKPGFSMLKSILQNQQYKVDTLNLLTQKDPQVPSDCKLLIIAGPRYAPTKKEMDAINKYVDQGGNVFLLLEPPPAPDFADFLKAHGVTPLAGQVTDPMSSAEGNPQILATLPESHDVTRGLQFIVLPTSIAFEVQEAEPPPAMPGSPPPPQPKARPLLKTSEAAKVAGLSGRSGPFTVAVAIDESPPPPPEMPGMPPQEQQSSERRARIIVVGDSDWITDNLISMLGGFGRQNLAFASMAVNWLVKNEKLVNIPPKEPPEMPFNVTDAQRRFTWLVTIGIVPLLIIATGVYVWWRRRG